MMTRKDYLEIARIHRECLADAHGDAKATDLVVESAFKFCQMFKRDNPRFRTQPFADACNLSEFAEWWIHGRSGR